MPRGIVDAGSFRDPAGQIFLDSGRVLRTVMPVAAEDFEYVRSTGLVEQLVSRDMLIAETPRELSEFPELPRDARYLLEHPLSLIHI